VYRTRPVPRLAFVVFTALAGCGNNAAPKCLAGDQVQCRCSDAGGTDGGALYGYRTCAEASGAADYGVCRCTPGLLPNLGSPLSTPYMSGTGTGNTADAGAR